MTAGTRLKSLRLGARRFMRAIPPRQFSRKTIRPTYRSIVRSILIAAASMAASTVSRGRPMPIWDCRLGSISRAGSSSRKTHPICCARSWRGLLIDAAPSRSARTPTLSACRKEISTDAAHSRGAARAVPSGQHRHQIGAGGARHRHSRRNGEAAAVLGRDLAHHARPQACPRDGAPRRDAATAARNDAHTGRCRHSGLRPRLADDPGAQ